MPIAPLSAAYWPFKRRNTAGPLSGVTPTFTALYDPALARVQLYGTGFYPGTARAVIDRYDTVTLTNPDEVRGGDVDPLTEAQSLLLDDREFTPGAPNTYRLRVYGLGDVLLGTVLATVTPVLTATWLRSPTRPFLDRQITIVDFSDVATPSRAGVFEVLGRRLPVAITEVRGSRRYTLVLKTETLDEARAVELFLSFGDVILIQVPDGCVVPGPVYALVGDVTQARRGKHDTTRRYFTLPLTEVAAPASSIAGATITWTGVINAYATWADVIAAKATWIDLMTSISAPDDEVVG